MAHAIALIGGTGPEGRGLATRFALAGHRVSIGSRDAQRGIETAQALSAALQPTHPEVQIVGTDNASAAAAAEIVVIVVPYAAHAATLTGLREMLAGKVVIDAVVPMIFDRGPRPVTVEAGSAAEEAQALLGPEVHVVGAFHNLAADVLLDPAASLDADVLVTGGDAEAKRTVIALAEQIAGVRGVDAGPLRFSRFVEGLTVLLAGINGRYHAHTGVRIVGLDLTPGTPSDR